MLVKKVLPSYLYGFFAAVILGAVLSTFNSVLNSASTIFCLDIYKKLIDKNATDSKLVKYGKTSSFILAIIAISVAPLVAYAPDGLYQLLQQLNGIFFIPISSIIIAGIFFKQINTNGAKAGLFFGFTFYILTTFILNIDIHFVHLWGIEFVLNFIIMFLVSRYSVDVQTFSYNKVNISNEKHWANVNLMGIILILMTISFYIFLS
ncbi:hypothetical protein [Seonamhaeicola sp. S2-3]|uniref:sodium:solute symporter family transporter n=1 Tax=Seonamhaeicola sp. S2-3 TaxID=1936081 RepID=UPI0020C7B6ED|nr:hypothetical protein [Seonamhaeicola sp. S2-3]